MHNGKKILAIDPVTPESNIIAKAGKILQKNGVVIFPTQCLYGIAANALKLKAVSKVFHLKHRPLDNPILVLIADRDFLPELVTAIPQKAYKLMDAFWPGNLTLVFEAKNNIPEILTAGTGKLGIRVASHPVAKALVKSLKFPITGTSANLSGHNSCNRTDQLSLSIINSVDLVLDAGTLKGGTGSSIVDVTDSSINIIREGEITTDQISRALAI